MTAAIVAAGLVAVFAAMGLRSLSSEARPAPAAPEPEPLFDFGDIVWDWPGYPQNLDFRDSGDRLRSHLLAASRAGFTDGG